MGVPDPSSFEQLRARCAAVGFDLDKAGSALIERMMLMSECSSKAFDDALRLASYAEDVFQHYEKTAPAEVFDAVERRTVILASFFSDIGKTGPPEADLAGSRLIIDAFAVENVRDDTQSMVSFFRGYFPEDAEDRIRRFTALGLDAGMSVREFWNLHSGWTLGIVETAGLPPEAVAAAATHHLLDDVNPGAIVGADDRFTRRFGANAAFDRAEKLVILLDKYDAVRRRGKRSHADAIGWLRDRLAKHPRFADDPEFLALLDAMNVALAQT